MVSMSNFRRVFFTKKVVVRKPSHFWPYECDVTALKALYRLFSWLSDPTDQFEAFTVDDGVN